MQSLSKIERETIVNYNEAEKEATVYTHNPSLIRRLEKLSEEYPEECRLINRSRFGQAADFTVPKSWIKVKPPRKVGEEQRERARERMKKFHQKRNEMTEISNGEAEGM